MIKRLGITVLILFILLISVSFSSAITGGMGNARMILYPEVNGWTNTVIEKSILVKNVNDAIINITLEVDKDSKDFIELIDNFYQLEPDTEERAQFVIKVKKEGTYNGRINVYFQDAINEKAPGVALASEIIIIAKKDQGYDEIDDDDASDNTGNDENSDVITGDAINGEDNEKKNLSLGLIILICTVFILLIILISLMVVLKKKNKKKRRKINGKNKS